MKKLLSLLLALFLLLSLLPSSAFAADTLRAERKNLADSWRYQNGQLRPQEDSPAPQPAPEPYHPDATLQGVDVSAWQGEVDWERVKAAGIDFAILRCGYGMDQEDQDDEYFDYNASECERLGIPYGVYLYSYADSVERASSEADHVLRLIRGRNLSYPVYYDMEDNSTVGADLPAIAKTFCSKITAAGYPVGVYSSTWWWNNYLTDPCFDNWHRWVAQYYTSCTYGGTYAMWQYSDSGSVDGINGPADMNYQIGYPTNHGASPLLSTDRSTYSQGDPVRVTARHSGRDAWVGLFRAGDDLSDGEIQPLFRAGLRGTDGPIDLTNGADLSPGNYTVALFADSERTLAAAVGITVTKKEISRQTDPATCTTDGSITVTYADGTTEVTILPALGHDWDEGTVTRRPTAALHGIMTYSCRRCGETRSQPIFSEGNREVLRIQGKTRYETALKTAETMKQILGVSQFDTMVVASGTGFADALGGSYLAARRSAPILLASAAPYDRMAADYIRENLAPGGTVYLLGGTAAVPGTMEDLLAGLNVIRLSGPDRYATNLAILREAGIAPGTEILVCTGDNFADSLSCSATAMPILLVNHQAGTLTPAQREFLSGTDAGFCIVGGSGAVGTGFESALTEFGSIRRLSGTDRYETSVLVAKAFFVYPSAAVLAYSRNFPDGLCGGALAASLGIPLLLTKSGSGVAAALYASDYSISHGYVLGGSSLIDDATVRWIFRMGNEAPIEVR